MFLSIFIVVTASKKHILMMFWSYFMNETVFKLSLTATIILKVTYKTLFSLIQDELYQIVSGVSLYLQQHILHSVSF
jgi:hypothetical protein